MILSDKFFGINVVMENIVIEEYIHIISFAQQHIIC